MKFVEGDLERCFRTSQAHLRFPTLNLQNYTDTLFASKNSVRGYTCAQIFTDGRKFFRVYPLIREGDAHHALTAFIQEVGITKNCLGDGAKEERGAKCRVLDRRADRPRSTRYDPLDTYRIAYRGCFVLWWIVSSFTVHLRYDPRTWYIQCTRRYTVQFYRLYTVHCTGTDQQRPAARTECPPYYACSTSYYFLHNIYNVYVRRS
jgi:hypothetical protein